VDLEGMSGQNDTFGIYSGRIRVEQRAHRDKGRSLGVTSDRLRLGLN
jgi:hypothetical protein